MNVSDIREHMKVVGSEHHYIPADWVDRIEGNEVKLRKSASDTCSSWQS